MLIFFLPFSQPGKILPRNSSNRSRTLISYYSNEKNSSISNTSGAKLLSSEHLQDVSVSVKHCNGFLLPQTMLHQLKPPQQLAVSHLRSETSSPLPKQKVYVIPGADLTEEQDREREKEGNWTGEGGEGQRTYSLSSGKPHVDWSMSDDEVSLPLDVEIHNGQHKHTNEHSPNPAKHPGLRIHFQCNDSDTLKVSLTKLMFSVTLIKMSIATTES